MEPGQHYDPERMEAALRGALEGVFQTMLSLPVQPLERNSAPRSDAPGFTAEVALAGERRGSVRVVCDGQAARVLAASLLMVDDPSELGDDEVLDAVGECANMLAGGVKTRALDPLGPWSMGTPDCQRCAVRVGEGASGSVASGLGTGILVLELHWADGNGEHEAQLPCR